MRYVGYYEELIGEKFYESDDSLFYKMLLLFLDCARTVDGHDEEIRPLHRT
jgi:hypothetical protein